VNGTHFVWQLIKIVCGFVLAVIACGLFLSWGLFQPGHPDLDPVAFAAMIWTGFVTASAVGAAAFVPALAVILISEAGRFSGFIFHVAAGGAIAFVLWAVEGAGGAAIRPGSPVALAAGFIAGGVYWLVAGRTAGHWHRQRPSEPVGNDRDEAL